MSWPLFFAQTPTDPGTPVQLPPPPPPPGAPATPAVTDPAAVTPAPVDPAASTPAPVDPATPVVPMELSTPATDVTPMVVQPTPDIQYEQIAPTGLGMGQWTVLVLFAGVCLGLIGCVLFSTSKSDIGGAIVGGSAAPFRGKKSGEEQLTQMTTWFAMAFIVMSLAMAFVFRM